MLELKQLETGYGEVAVIHGLDLNVQQGQVHALLGRNGVGKSTTLKAIIGQLTTTGGEIQLDNRTINTLSSFDRTRLGLAYVPETRDIFGSLTVLENLQLAARIAPPHSAWNIERVIALFPNLGQRLSNGGNQLSGGEQQMLAIARALMMAPQILLLDEPTEGLAPIIIQQIFQQLQQLKNEGLTLLLVEQNFKFASKLADQISILGRGQVVWSGTPEALDKEQDILHKWLGV